MPTRSTLFYPPRARSPVIAGPQQERAGIVWEPARYSVTGLLLVRIPEDGTSESRFHTTMVGDLVDEDVYLLQTSLPLCKSR